jgi:hypothetical protein
VAFGRIGLAWVVVAGWLLGWALVERRFGGAVVPRRRDARRDIRRGSGAGAWWCVGEALLLVLLGTLWVGSLGAGSTWLVFLLVGTLMAWPPRTPGGVARIGRVVVAGELLALALGR